MFFQCINRWMGLALLACIAFAFVWAAIGIGGAVLTGVPAWLPAAAVCWLITCGVIVGTLFLMCGTTALTTNGNLGFASLFGGFGGLFGSRCGCGDGRSGWQPPPPPNPWPWLLDQARKGKDALDAAAAEARRREEELDALAGRLKGAAADEAKKRAEQAKEQRQRFEDAGRSLLEAAGHAHINLP